MNNQNISLILRKYAKENRRKSWFYTLSTLFLLIMLLTGILLFNLVWIELLCSIFSGLVIVRMFVIYHDYLHQSILQKSKFANIIFSLFGLYILTPKTIWKRSHSYHHANNSKLFKSSIGSYPVCTKKKFYEFNKKERRQYLFVRHPLVILFGYYFTFLYGMCIKPLILNFSKHRDSLYSIILHFSIQFAIFYFFGISELILFCFIPHFISGAIGTYLFYAQHNFPGVKYYSDEDWAYESAALEASSYMKLNNFWCWVTGNIGYHHIHHLNSKIPFYELPKIMSLFPDLQNPTSTSLNFKDISACLKLKVWDVEKQQMIELR